MKKITLSIVVLSTLLIFACEEKKTTTPTPNNPVITSTYYIKANINGVSKEFTNLTVFRDETVGRVSLQIVANNTSSKNPKFEFNFNEPSTGWSNNLNVLLDGTNLDYVKYTTEGGKVYTSTNNETGVEALNVKFTSLNFVKDGLINADMNGILSNDQDTTNVYITTGKLKLKAD